MGDHRRGDLENRDLYEATREPREKNRSDRHRCGRRRNLVVDEVLSSEEEARQGVI
jgi:hypothetical protein